jgi:DNA-binding XRE family transcriptional regulator
VVAGELDNDQAFGGLLRAWRADAGLTQDQLAECSGLSIRTIRDLERGRVRRPHRESIGLLAAALDLPPAALDELARAGRRPLARLESFTAGAGMPMRPGPAAGGAGRPVPRQLPPAIQHFTGRTEALKVLMELVGEVPAPAGTVVISAIDGSAGVGKTALAVHWAHQVAERFPGGQLHVDLRGFDPGCSPLPPSAAIRGFLDALGVPPAQIPASPEALTARYRSLLAGRRMLVLLDNARDASQVRPLLPAAPGCLVIVTSRTRLLSLVAAEGAHPLTLDLLTVAEARELLERRMGAKRFSRERGTADELIELCARLPLALNIVAARAAGEPCRSLAALAGQLRDARHRLDMLDTGDRVADVRAAFSWSCQHLAPLTARMFRLLGGVHPGPDISAPATASLAGVPLGQARRALAELAAARLVAEQPAGRFSLHDLLRAYAAEQAQAHESETERRAALHRMLDHYLHTTCRAALLLAPARDPLTLAVPQPGAVPEDLADYAQALSWLEAEHPVLLRAVATAAAAGLDTYAWQFPWGLSDFCPAAAAGRHALRASVSGSPEPVPAAWVTPPAQR